MNLFKIIFLVAAFVAVSAVDIQSEKDLQAEETNVAHTRQKRAPLLLKKLLIGGLLAKKAVLLGGGLGLAGAGLGAILTHKLSHGERGYPAYVNNGPSGSGHVGTPVYIEHAPPARPPVYYDHYPPAHPGGHYGTPVYPTYPRPLPPPPPPSFGPDCYTGGPSYNNLYNSARASAGYA